MGRRSDGGVFHAPPLLLLPTFLTLPALPPPNCFSAFIPCFTLRLISFESPLAASAVVIKKKIDDRLQYEETV